MSRGFVILIACALSQSVLAQTPDDAAVPGRGAADRASAGDNHTPEDATTSERAETLEDDLTDVKFVGKFTFDGRPDAAPKAEEYTIKRCEKLAAEHMYRLTARIQYGDVDSEVPLDLKILWAGNTPVITLDALWIPGMGTFSARVLLHRGRYSGTWQHGDKGGHLFGKIVDNNDSPSAD